MAFNRQLSLDEAMDVLLDAIEMLDPTGSVPVYDVESLNIKGHRQFSMVDSQWLYEIWRKANPDELLMPHDHIGD